MSSKQIQNFFESFQDAFRQVLCQCSGKDWSVSKTAVPSSSEIQWVNATASGPFSGEFAFGFSQQAGILLAQILMMSETPAASYASEEKEAVAELLRQVCGLCATALVKGTQQPTLTINGEATLASDPAEQCRLVFAQDHQNRFEIVLAITASLATSIEALEKPQAPIQSSPETDRTSLDEALSTRNLDLLMDVRLGVRLRFGSRRMKLREILDFHAGTIVELDRQVQEPVDLLVDNKLIARGEVVVVDGNYGLKVTDVLSPKQCMEALY